MSVHDDWFTEADSDLRAAQLLCDNGFYAKCAFHCQQAGEKAMKALLYAQAQRPRGHSVADLLTAYVTLTNLSPDLRVADAARHLDLHYTSTRYPDAAPMTPSSHYQLYEAEESLDHAQTIVDYARGILYAAT